MPHYLGEIPMLSRLTPGEVSLGVPIREGAVQINRPSPEKSRLAVDIGPDAVTVAREDEEPLQIEAHFEEWNENKGFVPVSRILLSDPVDQMTFVSLDKEWTVDDLPLTDETNIKHLTIFATLIGRHALSKQLRNQGPKR